MIWVSKRKIHVYRTYGGFRLNNNPFIAIWDNRSVYHAATFDYSEKRTGQRAVGLGEKPYLDPASVSRREALGQDVDVL